MTGTAPEQLPAEREPWWREAVVHEVYVRSFADSDADGVGDLPGVTDRLPYLADLGVDAVWLTPFYRSPMADHGYDVADPRDVDPLFGSLEAFDELLERAHRLGLRVVVDQVPNHVSTEHPWFRAALEAGPGSPERERFHFRPGRGPDGAEPPNNWESAFGGTAWSRTEDGEWYLHIFAPQQADLDWSHPDVGDEYESVLRFWLDRGVDGFRVDVAQGLVKAPGLPDVEGDPSQDLVRSERGRALPQWDQDGVHEIWRRWRRVLDSYDGDRMMVGEVWVSDPERFALYVRDDEMHQAFNIPMLFAGWSADELRTVVDEWVEAHERVAAPVTWVLSNHDVVRHRTRFAGGTDDGGLARARAAALWLLALPGGAYTYAGEELGLPEVDVPPEAREDPVWERSGGTQTGRDGCRVPLPWTDDAPPYGFGPPGRVGQPWLPQPDGWGEHSVERQTGDPCGVLELYRAALRLRREHLVGSGPLHWRDDLADGRDDVLVSQRGDDGPLCVLVLDGEPLELPAGRVLLRSDTAVGEDGPAALPRDAAAWLLP